MTGSVHASGHLAPVVSGRGFRHFPPIPSRDGGQARVVESSLAEGPHIRLYATAPSDLNDPHSEPVEAPLHFTAENARQLGEQLINLADNHYQNRQARHSGSLREALERFIRQNEDPLIAADPIHREGCDGDGSCNACLIHVIKATLAAHPAAAGDS